MRLCDLGHEEVAYTAWSCPVCERDRSINNLEARVMDLEASLEDKKQEVADLNTKVSEGGSLTNHETAAQSRPSLH